MQHGLPWFRKVIPAYTCLMPFTRWAKEFLVPRCMPRTCQQFNARLRLDCHFEYGHVLGVGGMEDTHATAIAGSLTVMAQPRSLDLFPKAQRGAANTKRSDDTLPFGTAIALSEQSSYRDYLVGDTHLACGSVHMVAVDALQ